MASRLTLGQDRCIASASQAYLLRGADARQRRVRTPRVYTKINVLLTLFVDLSGLCCTATRRLRRSLAFMASRWRCGARSTSCSKESRVCARTCRIRDAVAHGAARSAAREPRPLRQVEGDCHVVAGSGQQRCQQRVRHPRRVADETLAGWRRTWSRSARAI